MSVYGSKATNTKLMFQPIVAPTTKRPQPKPKSKVEERSEKDKKANPHSESEGTKTDPLHLMTPEELNELASIGLEMFQKSLALCASESGFKTVIRNIQRMNLGCYVDDIFKPELKCLVGDNLINRSPWRAFVWLHPDQFVKNISIFGRDKPTVSPDDVRQGLIGDGYLIASLASLAEVSQRIVNIFALYEEDPMFGKDHGLYSINIFLAGHPFELVLDDYFPCISEEKGSAFCQVVDGKLWPIMIEKAWAKLYFSYDNIDSGMSSDVLRDLTGAPVKSLWMEDDPENVWKELVDAHTKKYPMTAGSKEFNQGIDFINEVGIVSSHSYSCLGGYEVKKKDGGVVKLVKMRSVFPEAVYKGKWSLLSENNEWDDIPEKGLFQEKIKHSKLVFFIEYDDFQKYFDNVQFCLMNDSFQYSFLTKKVSKKVGEYFKINIPKEGRHYFSMSQEPLKRYSKTYRDKYDYAEIKVALGRNLGDNQFEYIASTQFGKKDVWVTHESETIPAGEYIMYAKVNWPAFNEKEATVSVYGTEKCRIDDELNFGYKGWLEKLWLDFAVKKITKTKVNLKDQGAPNSEYCAEKTTNGFGFIAVWNKESNKKLICEFRLKNSTEYKLKFKESFSKKDIACFELLPGESKIALVGVGKYFDYGDERNTQLYHSCTIKAVPL